MRADQCLVDRGLAASRSQAQRLIASGVQWRVGAGPWRAVTKNGDEVPEGAEVLLQDDAEARYVSRGGLKLEGALAACGVSVQGLTCLDVGQSTGGFTDCLLAHGARRVVGVDVGHGQLHPRLKNDPRVVSLEGVNARHLQDCTALQGQVFDLLVMDASFISLTLLLPGVLPFLRAQGQCLLLVKPQFELQATDLGKGGVVRDPALYVQVEQRLRDACASLGLQVKAWLPSPIQGGDGNHEFFLWGERGSPEAMTTA